MRRRTFLFAAAPFAATARAQERLKQALAAQARPAAEVWYDVLEHSLIGAVYVGVTGRA